MRFVIGVHSSRKPDPLQQLSRGIQPLLLVVRGFLARLGYSSYDAVHDGELPRLDLGLFGAGAFPVNERNKAHGRAGAP